MPVRWAIAGGNWSNLAIWNDSASLGFPTASDDIWANNNNINIDQSFEVRSLNSTARARDVVTPVMTSNTTPVPYIVNASGGGTPFLAFDGSTATTYTHTPGGTSFWVSIDLVSASIVDGYGIAGGSVQTRNPRNWALEGSNNNIAWTILHTVSQSVGIASSATYRNESIGNSTAYRYYRVNVSLNGGDAGQTNIAEIYLSAPFTATLTAGGSFVFNSGSISGSATSTTAALTAGATNLIQVTATTGSVGLTIGSAITGLGTATTQIFNHTGNCDFNLNGQSFIGGSATNAVCIAKSSTGVITINGDLRGGSVAAGYGLSSTNGNTIINGNSLNTVAGSILQTAGNLTITGNISAGSGNAAITLSGAASQFTIIGNVTGGTGGAAVGINHSGTSGSVIGNVTGGSATSAHGINTVGAVTVTGTVTGGAGSNAHGINTTGVLTVTGNVIANTANGIFTTNNVILIGNSTGGTTGAGVSSATNAITMTITGTVTAGSGLAGAYNTGTGTVNLTGNMVNVAGKNAVFSQNLFISNAATSQWRLFTQGGQDKTLYSADTFPNQPTSANVRSGSLFGPANALSGSMVVPAPSDVRVNVLTDNTVGTGQSLTAADFLAAISSSADPFAERLRNVATVDTVGSLVTGLNGGF